MRRVAASEHDLLTVARALVGRAPVAPLRPLLRARRVLPEAMGPTALELLRDTLTQGLVTTLARRGGWRQRRCLDADQAGRVWQRHTPPRLVLGPSTLTILRWLVAEPMGPTASPLSANAALSLGDALVALLACDLLREAELAQAIPQPLFLATPLCWLAHLDVLAGDEPPTTLDFAPLTQGDGAVVLECIADHLARSQIRLERRKPQIQRCQEMTRLGQAQDAVYQAWLSATDGAGRRDLAQFLRWAASGAFSHRPTARQLIGSLHGRGTSVRARSEAITAAGALLRALARLDSWSAAHRATRIFDDGYDVAQHLLTDAEAHLGATTHAATMLRELRTLDVMDI